MAEAALLTQPGLALQHLRTLRHVDAADPLDNALACLALALIADGILETGTEPAGSRT